ncbi:hypothetical protein MKW98_001130 [Papaver atlanticum]|uniref:Uncharacterized protein n=1 Tax=Papaver atlanticum TaxID=357466 RepID=A0AAD4XKX2_9MAGN|nr:hypothetical protein MKW98_001130 [Papaver atlanticum]
MNNTIKTIDTSIPSAEKEIFQIVSLQAGKKLNLLFLSIPGANVEFLIEIPVDVVLQCSWSSLILLSGVVAAVTLLLYVQGIVLFLGSEF